MLSLIGSGEKRLFSSLSVNSSRTDTGISKSGDGGVSVSSSSSPSSVMSELNPGRTRMEDRSRTEIKYSFP